MYVLIYVSACIVIEDIPLGVLILIKTQSKHMKFLFDLIAEWIQMTPKQYRLLLFP